MAIDYESCRAYFQGETVPLIFEVYTESGLPFVVIPDPLEDEPYANASALVKVKDAEGNYLPGSGYGLLIAKVIEDNPSRKKFVASWNTSLYNLGYYLLQVWVCVNITGEVNSEGKYVVEGKLASQELVRYIKQ